MMEKDGKRIILGRMGIDQYLEMVDTVVKPNGLSYLPTFLILSKILSKKLRQITSLCNFRTEVKYLSNEIAHRSVLAKLNT